jgi:hypothetical protein
MQRSLLTILIVAAISGWISAGERAVGRSAGSDWVRTSDGWEPRFAIESQDEWVPPAVHPGVVAALQLGVSLLFLLAYPSRVRELAANRAAAYFQERRRGFDRRQAGDRRHSLPAAVAG